MLFFLNKKSPDLISAGNTYAARNDFLSSLLFTSPLFITQIKIYRWERSVKLLTRRGHLCWSVLLPGGMNGCRWNREWLRIISLHLCGVAIIPYHFLKEIEHVALIIPHLACFEVYLEEMTSWWISATMSASISPLISWSSPIEIFNH